MALWPFFGLGRVEASASERAAAAAAPPIETLVAPQDSPTFVAGGAETRGALPLTTETFEAALYSSRGKGYARYNEDGAVLYRDERGHLYAAVFDQAGGLGGEVRGEGSGIAAKSAFEAFRQVAKGQPPDDQVGPLLVDAGIMGAHGELVAREQGEVTTAVLCVARPDHALLATSGDSAAYHFDAEGRHLAQTVKHEVTTPFGVGALTHAVGLEPERPSALTYTWDLAPGHWLLMASDGLLDSGLGPDEWAELLLEAGGPEGAVNELARRVLRRMAMLRAKPDNLTILAVRRRPDAA